MEDDRVEENNSQEKKGGGFILFFGGGFIVLMVALVIIGFFLPDHKDKNRSEITQKIVTPPPAPHETKEDYIKSTKRVGNSKAPIYQKEFLKSPDKFTGTRLNLIGKIMNIEEAKGETFIQAFVNNDYDVINIYYPGSISVYKDDIVTIYGEGAGKMMGQNRMGAEMSWPLVKAKYIIKKKISREG